MEQLEEDKHKWRESSAQMGITLENNDFSKNSETLLKDIEQTQKKKENKQTFNLFSSQLVLNEIQDLNEQR